MCSQTQEKAGLGLRQDRGCQGAPPSRQPAARPGGPVGGVGLGGRNDKWPRGAQGPGVQSLVSKGLGHRAGARYVRKGSREDARYERSRLSGQSGPPCSAAASGTQDVAVTRQWGRSCPTGPLRLIAALASSWEAPAGPLLWLKGAVGCRWPACVPRQAEGP